MRRMLSRATSFRRASRSIWTACTFLAETPDKLVEIAQARFRSSDENPQALLYALSSNMPQEQADLLFEHLSAQPGSVGAILNPLQVNRFSLAIAEWRHEFVKAIPFKSELAGKPAIAIGREVRPIFDDSRNLAFDETRPWTTRWGTESQQYSMPSELSDIGEIDHMVFFSDNAPQGFISCLNDHSLHANKLGLIAAPTPFITGLPFTLIKSKEVISKGAVGIAIPRSKSVPPLQLKTMVSGWQPLGPVLRITNAQGNIILTLDDQPAAALLLHYLRESGAVTKEECYFGLVPEEHQLSSCPPEQATEIVQITAGSPTKGRMALDTEASLIKGQKGQFYVREANSIQNSAAGTQSVPFSFHIKSPAIAAASDPSSGSTFIASSDQGLVSGMADSKAWLSRLSGHKVTLHRHN